MKAYGQKRGKVTKKAVKKNPRLLEMESPTDSSAMARRQGKKATVEPIHFLDEETAIELLWTAKSAGITNADGSYQKGADGKIVPNPNWCNVFLYATTREAVVFRRDDVATRRPAGTRVLVTMVSRFGDVGIREHNLVPASHGYSARVIPSLLTKWSRTP